MSDPNQEETQLGTVIVLRKDITQEEINDFLEKIREYIDPNYYHSGEPSIHQFEPEIGGPVWYVP